MSPIKMIVLACLILVACTEEQNVGYLGSPPSATSRAAIGSTQLWAIAVPGYSGDGVAMDSIGDVIAVGGGLITKRAAFDGSERWTVTLNGGTSQLAGVGVDSDDAVIVAGSCQGSVDFGGETLSCPPNDSSGFLAKYKSTGTLDWVRLLGTGGSMQAIAVAPDGRTTIGGDFTGTIQLGTQTFTATADSNAFLATYDWTGSFVWGSAFLAGPLISTLSLAPNGDVIAAGALESAASVGGAVLSPDGTSHAFVARFRRDGLYLSSSTVGASSDSRASQVAIDAEGHVAVESLESETGSGSMNTRLHLLDSEDADIWLSQIENDDGGSQQNRVLVANDDGSIASAQWVDNWYSKASYMEVVAYNDAGAPEIVRFGSRIPTSSSAGDMGFRKGTTGALGVASFVGDLGGTVDFGNGPISAVGTSTLVVAHFVLPAVSGPDDEVVGDVAVAP